MVNNTKLQADATVADKPGRLRLDSRQITTSISAGVVVGVINLAFTLSIAALIFSGPLTGFVANGVGLVLLGACVMNCLLALLSSRPAMIMTIQDAPAVVVALVAATVAAGQPADSATYATVVAAIALTTLATGATFFILGQFRLGSLVRYLPYPVIGGFLAGTGWLLALGGISVMTGAPPDVRSIPGLLAPPVLWQWLPGMLFACVILASLRRTRHALVLPALLLGATALFYGWLAFSGVSLAEAQRLGWLLGPFPDRALWSPFTPTMLAEVRWPSIANQLGTIGTAMAISVIGLLLNVSGLQLARREEIDLNRELRAASVTQFVAGLFGSPPGYHMLSLSMLAHRTGARTRLVGIVVAVVFALAFFFGATLLALVPRVVLGGMVCYLGLAFLAEWLYDSWFKLPRLDYALIVLILTLIALFGILPGMGAGLLIAVALFVVAYSRIDVVKHTLSGATIKSRMTRGHADQQWLREHGLQIAIFQLQGFLFFGTAHALYERVRLRTLEAHLPELRFVLLDFRLVQRLDSTALLSFTKMLQLAEGKQLTLIFTQLAPAVSAQIERGLLQGNGKPSIRIFPDLDRGLEWCENALLGAAEAHGEGAPLVPTLAVLSYFEQRTVGPGEYLMRQGSQPEDMFFIASGQVTAQIEPSDGPPLRLETMRGGRMVGELGFFLGRQRTAAVVADETSSVYRITRPALQQLEQANPEAAAAFHLIIARLLSERVVHLIETVDALQR